MHMNRKTGKNGCELIHLSFFSFHVHHSQNKILLSLKESECGDGSNKNDENV